MHTCDGFKLLLSEEDYEERLERIEMVAGMDLVGRSVATATKDSTVRPRTQRVLATKPIPKLPVADILRGRDFLTGNIPKAMCGVFEKHGSVVRVPISMDGQPVVALMGPDCNNWVNKQGRFYLRSKDYIQGLEGVFGASRTMPGMDGAERVGDGEQQPDRHREPGCRGCVQCGDSGDLDDAHVVGGKARQLGIQVDQEQDQHEE
jgi:hypothetical protein